MFVLLFHDSWKTNTQSGAKEPRQNPNNIIVQLVRVAFTCSFSSGSNAVARYYDDVWTP